MKYSSGIETRDSILHVSKELFFKNGFKHTSIRQIASKANVTSGALYKHFSSKEDILDTIISPHVDDWWENCNRLLHEFERDLPKAKTTEDINRLLNRNGSNWIYTYMRRNPDIWRYIFFHSAGTKYETFFDDFMKYETDITLKILNKIDSEKKYLEVASEIEIYYILRGFYSMGLSAFEDDFDDAKRMNYFSVLESMYKPFWEKIFSLNF